MELERRRLTAEMIVPDTGESVRTEIEVRIDPLTGHSSRILPDRGLMPANELDLEAYARAVMLAEPESWWASINANHMLPSGSSLFHPHLQIRPAGVSRERRAAVRGPTKVDAWDDFPSVSGSTFLRGGTAGASRCWGDGSFQRRRVLGCRGRVGSIWPRSRSMSHDAW